MTDHSRSPQLDMFSISFDGSVNPVDKLGDSSVDARFHGIGTSQTPGCHTLYDEFALGVTHQRTTAVTLWQNTQTLL